MISKIASRVAARWLRAADQQAVVTAMHHLVQKLNKIMPEVKANGGKKILLQWEAPDGVSSGLTYRPEDQPEKGRWKGYHEWVLKFDEKKDEILFHFRGRAIERFPDASKSLTPPDESNASMNARSKAVDAIANAILKHADQLGKLMSEHVEEISSEGERAKRLE